MAERLLTSSWKSREVSHRDKQDSSFGLHSLRSNLRQHRIRRMDELRLGDAVVVHLPGPRVHRRIRDNLGAFQFGNLGVS